ncbi:MAG: prefoldin subunit beta [Euryarchaeota archaeon]|nr:prefoldin subunit beta [Euryarchaeota archaeon]
MAQGELPPQIKDQLQQFQSLQNQLQVLAQQKAQMEARSKEFQRAQEALGEAADDTTVYRNVGSLLIKTKGKEAVLKDIGDESETLEVRLKNFEKQESRLRESLTELQSKIENGLRRMQGGGQSE